MTTAGRHHTEVKVIPAEAGGSRHRPASGVLRQVWCCRHNAGAAARRAAPRRRPAPPTADRRCVRCGAQRASGTVFAAGRREPELHFLDLVGRGRQQLRS